jgi:hypothetical protein
MAAVKQILRYVVSMVNWGLQFNKGCGAAILTGFSDSNFFGDVDSRKSTSDIFFFLCGSPITWQSSKQSIVAQSSCEA